MQLVLERQCLKLSTLQSYARRYSGKEFEVDALSSHSKSPSAQRQLTDCIDTTEMPCRRLGDSSPSSGNCKFKTTGTVYRLDSHTGTDWRAVGKATCRWLVRRVGTAERRPVQRRRNAPDPRRNEPIVECETWGRRRSGTPSRSTGDSVQPARQIQPVPFCISMLLLRESPIMFNV